MLVNNMLWPNVTELAAHRNPADSTPEGTTSYLQADLRDPGMILQEAARTLGFAQPAAVILAAILQLISDEEDPYGIGYVRES
jgi:hypothetical protein